MSYVNIMEKNLNLVFNRVQTYTNMSYRLKGIENRSQITRRNKGLLRENTSWVKLKVGFARQSQAPIPRMEVQEQSTSARRLQTQCWLGLTAMGLPPLTIYTLKGKVYSCWTERNFTSKGQKWRQLEIHYVAPEIAWNRSIIPIPNFRDLEAG